MITIKVERNVPHTDVMCRREVNVSDAEFSVMQCCSTFINDTVAALQRDVDADIAEVLRDNTTSDSNVETHRYNVGDTVTIVNGSSVNDGRTGELHAHIDRDLWMVSIGTGALWRHKETEFRGV